jgi:hypothetical protein
VGLAIGPGGIAETDELLLYVVAMLLELEEIRLEEVKTAELEDPVEADDEVTELEEPADLFCTVANVVPTKVVLLLGSMAL